MDQTVPIMNEKAHVVAFRDHLVYHTNLDTLASSHAGDPNAFFLDRMPFYFFADKVCFDSCDKFSKLRSNTIHLIGVGRERFNLALHNHVEGARNFHGHLDKAAMTNTVFEALQAFSIGTMVESDAHDDVEFCHV